ncbi:MAG: chemoreceptor glutamine deamidase CheD [Gammaproteobacteria bacterium]|nr:chemoreceptor glutamine deamidase CheD [Gammaproteobacteria bacterium]
MQTAPACLPQFKHIKRYWDQPRGMYVAKIMPGEFYVTKHHELISTLLGSCVAVCMRDAVNGVGGMNHFKLPTPKVGTTAGDDANYGLYAMEVLINGILKAGGKRQHLECRVFGGGNVLKSVDFNIGQKNIEFVKQFLHKEKIAIKGMDVGHESAQQIYYHPNSGNAFSLVSDSSRVEDLKRSEQEYLAKISHDAQKSSVIFLDDTP